jgi:hypothetical protein
MAGECDPWRFNEELRKEHNKPQSGRTPELGGRGVQLPTARLAQDLVSADTRGMGGMGMSGRYGRSASCGRHLSRESVDQGRQPALADLLRRVGTKRHPAVYNRRESSGSLVALTQQGNRQHIRLGSPFPAGGHSLRRGEGDPFIGACRV